MKKRKMSRVVAVGIVNDRIFAPRQKGTLAGNSSTQAKGKSFMLRLLDPIVREMQPGDFNFTIQAEEGKLLIPESLHTALRSVSVTTPAQFVSYVKSFPSAVALLLQWQVPDVIDASERLLEALRGVMPDSLLSPTPNPPPSFGARYPSSTPLVGNE